MGERCLRCGRRLTDPVSQERGYGPKCFGRPVSRRRGRRRKRRVVKVDWRQLDFFRGPQQLDLF